MPPQTAFYVVPIGRLLIAIIDISRQLVVEVSGAIATISFVTVSLIAVPNITEFILLTAALAVLAGAPSAQQPALKTCLNGVLSAAGAAAIIVFTNPGASIIQGLRIPVYINY